MSQHQFVGRYYQYAGRVREWLGAKQGNTESMDLGRRDQLVGRIAEHFGVTLIEADRLADELPAYERETIESHNLTAL
jgi:uncharacterized protein YjbJ (UPF0337 family)